jgi:hypothetical protein
MSAARYARFFGKPRLLPEAVTWSMAHPLRIATWSMVRSLRKNVLSGPSITFADGASSRDPRSAEVFAWSSTAGGRPPDMPGMR